MFDLLSSYRNARYIRIVLGRNLVAVDLVLDWVFRGYCAVLPRLFFIIIIIYYHHHGNLKNTRKNIIIKNLSGFRMEQKLGNCYGAGNPRLSSVVSLLGNAQIISSCC